ncbi:hypothetical protein NG895_25290 [Aeoliella sp. ICT_H6.2]|uniref:Uncharacterized protein n=1 Tax=Aeoliella straminimaris TaxID=2954799 RepID=A0A9X2FFH2_9BACT|nr:hypothetical protein [Aeoliella straminimaris]MCO6047228.1 hypothetical protein [Aeoliella straminimaris]
MKKSANHLIWIMAALALLMFAAIAGVTAVSNRREHVKELDCTAHLYKLRSALKEYETRYADSPFTDDNWRVALAKSELLPNTTPSEMLFQSQLESLFVVRMCIHQQKLADTTPRIFMWQPVTTISTD